MNEPLTVVILAGGKGTRMKSDLPKVITPLRGEPLFHHVIKAVLPLSPKKIIVVTGYKRELVEESIKNVAAFKEAPIVFAHQKEQLGTGDAAKAAIDELAQFTGTVLILYGDVPLSPTETFRNFLARHYLEKATLSLLSFKKEPPHSYGRVVRNATNYVSKIVEAKDSCPEELLIDECNSGLYAVDSAFLIPALKRLTNNNAQKEYYLTDIVEMCASEGQKAIAVDADIEELEGINNPLELSLATEILLTKTREKLLKSGVILEDPKTTYIDDGSEIAPGVRIGPNTTIKGSTSIAAGVVIEGNSWIDSCTIGEGGYFKFSVRAEKSTFLPRVVVGPFCNVRPESVIGEECHLGNFVELKKATLAKGVKANHLSYLGDCTIGEKTNVGAGTIFCNYDGYKKHHTKIGKEVFIGSNTSLVAPLEVGDGSLLAAGSVITKSVSADALAVTRSEQKEIAGWEKKRRERNTKK